MKEGKRHLTGPNRKLQVGSCMGGPSTYPLHSVPGAGWGLKDTGVRKEIYSVKDK